MPRCFTGLRTFAFVAGLMPLALACSKDGSTPPELSQPAKLTLVSGDGQSGNGAVLTTPLVVKVTDPRNQPVSGVPITWTASDPTASLIAVSSSTDEEGQAKASWILGASAGRQTVTASTSALPGALVVFQANGGGVLSGGVTLQSAPAVAFSALTRVATGTGQLSASALSARTVVQPAASARQISATSRGTRRLIVQFTETASALRTIARGAAMQANVGAMQHALASHLASHRVARAELSPAILAARVTVPEGTSMEAAAAALRADASVAQVTEDRIVPMLAPFAAYPAQPPARVTSQANTPLAGGIPGRLPNDPFLQPALWHYNLVDAPRAWTRTTGSRDVLVAVVDNGIRFDHPAMGTGAGSNITSDGYNFVTGGDRLGAPEPVCGGGTTTLPEAGPSPDPTQPDDLFWDGASCWVRSTLGNHGLHVAGTIGAVGDDGLGVTGLNWQVKIRPVRVLDITGSGSYFDIAQGVLYAAGLPAATDDQGHTVTAPTRAAIINMSLGGSFDSPVLASAITAATNAGSLIVASAGNGETSVASYPAAYPEVLAVSAVGPDLTIASYTNVGANVSLAAPGGNFRSSGSSGVASTVWDYVAKEPTYAYYEGTSMSAPHVVGIGALVLAANPGMTNVQLRARLQSTAVHVGAPGRNDQYGYGLVNAYNAITNSTGPARTIQVRVVRATTGAMVQQVPANADGSFSVSRLPPGSYFVYAGQDEDGDGRIGSPGRRFGWYGGPGGPTPITITAGGNAAASINIGTPVESKPHLTTATANRLVVNSYMVGQLTASDGPAYYVVTIPATGVYYFEVGGVLGACGFGIELNPALEIYDATGTLLATSDNAGLPGGSFCSAIVGQPNPGDYYMKVRNASPSSTGPAGQYRIWVRDAP